MTDTQLEAMGTKLDISAIRVTQKNFETKIQYEKEAIKIVEEVMLRGWATKSELEELEDMKSHLIVLNNGYIY